MILTWVVAMKMERHGFEIYLRGRLTTFNDKLDVENKEEGGAKDDTQVSVLSDGVNRGARH